MNKNFKIQFNPFKILGISQESSIKEARDKFIDVLGSCPEKKRPETSKFLSNIIYGFMV